MCKLFTLLVFACSKTNLPRLPPTTRPNPESIQPVRSAVIKTKIKEENFTETEGRQFSMTIAVEFTRWNARMRDESDSHASRRVERREAASRSMTTKVFQYQHDSPKMIGMYETVEMYQRKWIIFAR